MKVLLASVADATTPLPSFGDAVQRLHSHQIFQSSINTPTRENSSSKLDYEMIVKTFRELKISTYAYATINPMLDETIVQRHCSQADAFVFVAAEASISIGLLIGAAFRYQKPIIVLYRRNVVELPESLTLTDREDLQICPYDPESIHRVIKESIEYAQDSTGSRLHLSIPAKLHRFLAQEAEKKKISRSEFIRQLIQEELERVG